MSDINNEGGNAFPEVVWIGTKSVEETPVYEPPHGMSLRDYFAANAIEASVQKAIYNYKLMDIECEVFWDHIAESAYYAADEMLKARDK